jgi:hypothetical protein
MGPPSGRRSSHRNRASREGHARPADSVARLTESAQKKRPTRTYVIFECRFAQDLFCAVSTSLSIPDFLISGGWRFRGTVGKQGFMPSGFNAASAQKALSRDGFYLFTSTRTED